jgi:lysine-specific demethylase 8
MYPCEDYLTNNSSQIDLDCVDHEQFPRLAAAPFMECELQAGEMLYIPPRWWHYVRSLTSSFSVSFWWS